MRKAYLCYSWLIVVDDLNVNAHLYQQIEKCLILSSWPYGEHNSMNFFFQVLAKGSVLSAEVGVIQEVVGDTVAAAAPGLILREKH